MGTADDAGERTTTKQQCRLCDQFDAGACNIYDVRDDGKQIVHMIKECLPIVIYRSDPLPKSICHKCLRCVEEYYAFKLGAIRTHRDNVEQLRNTAEKNTNVQLYLSATETENSHEPRRCVECSRELEQEKTELELINELQDAITESLRKTNESQTDETEDEYRDETVAASCVSVNSQRVNGETRSQNGVSKSSSWTPGTISRATSIRKDTTIRENADYDEDGDDQFPILKRQLCKPEYTGPGGGGGFSERDIHEPPSKRPRLCGPKSRVRALERVRNKQLVFYEPLTLSMCTLNAINREHVPDFYCEPYTRRIVELHDELEILCSYCDTTFADTHSLAVHEGGHLRVALHEKVDNPQFWSPTRQDAHVRNKWLTCEIGTNEESMIMTRSAVAAAAAAVTTTTTRSPQEDEVEDLLVPIITTTTSLADNDADMYVDGQYDNNDEEQQSDGGGDLEQPDQDEAEEKAPIDGEIELIDTKPTVNGVLLSDIPKDDRRYLFKTIEIAGVRRKFCSLCRFTFKDNWAIELHYFSSACYYTCRYCGTRFNKQRGVYDDHILDHIRRGDPISTKIYASRKKNDPVPKVIHETRIKTVASVVRRMPKVKPLKMKNLLQRFGNSPNVKVEEDVDAGEVEAVYGGKQKAKEDATNKAYFCRKCFKVFSMLMEFNEHSSKCKGQSGTPSSANTTAAATNGFETSTPMSSKSNSESESFTSSGRPLRNCVKEVSYNDEFYSDVGRNSGSNSPVLAFECNYCGCTFPTFQSRNSHMRIHKNRGTSTNGGGGGGSYFHPQTPPSMDVVTKATSNNKSAASHGSGGGNILQNNLTSLYPQVSIKEEPMDEEDEDDEDDYEPTRSSRSSVRTSIGNVSITPIAANNSRNIKPINPEIMELVKNNPNLTIRSMNNPASSRSSMQPASNSGRPQQQQQQQQQQHHLQQQQQQQRAYSLAEQSANSSMMDESRMYRCSSCLKHFANKSTLYFHKKNQCGGSKYPCPFCKKRFGTEAAYSTHIFYSHPE